MSSRPVNLDTYRKIRVRARVYEAMEHLYQEVLARLGEQHHRVDPEELEDFLAQVLGDYLAGDLQTPVDIRRLDENYQRFDARLRKCLQGKIQSLHAFENLRGR